MPQPKKGSKSNTLERNIHFYRSFCGTNEAGKPLLYKQGPALATINKLPFTDHAAAGGRYFRDEENVYCCWVDSPNHLRFAVIRRDAFPQVEEEGLVSALNVPATAGLVEQIHVRFFPRNVVGFDFNFYGPRLPRLGRYLNRVGGEESPNVAFWPLLRHDAAKELEGNKDLRVFSFRAKRSMIDTVAKADKSLADALKATANIGEADEVQIILRPKAFSRDSIGHKFIQIARKMSKRSDLRQIASEFKVQVTEPGKASVAIDLLGDHFIADARILKQTKNGRALDSEDAFAKIEEAHAERQQELERAAALAPE
ncbi:MAG TPA: hypothetical protein VI039_11020 [Solirubrobacterales bacterium]